MSKLVRRLSSCLLFLSLAFFICLISQPASAEDPRVLATDDLWGFSLNSLGEAVWSQRDPGTGFAQLFSSKRGQLTFDRTTHLDPSINNLGDIAWVELESMAVRGIIGGKKVVISPGIEGTRYRTDINDRGEVLWSETNFNVGHVSYLVSSLRGRLSDGIILSDGPSINNQGDVVFRRFFDPNAPTAYFTPQLYKLPAGSTTAVAVTSGPSDISGGAISDNGEVVWVALNPEGRFGTEPDRVVSDRRGELLQAPAGTLGAVDVNNCGDLLYTQSSADGSALSLLQIGSAAPCPSIAGNDTRETAAAAVLGDVALGAADSATPVSWYRFEAAARDTVKVLVNYDTSAAQLEIGLYDAEGNFLAGPGSSLPPAITVKGSYSGSYYLKVTWQGGQRVGYALSFTRLSSCGSGPCPDIIADGDVRDGVSINSLGEVVWAQYIPASNRTELFSSTRGDLPPMMGGSYGQSSPAINAFGAMAWISSSPYPWSPWYGIYSTLQDPEMELFMGYSNQPIETVDLNDRGEMVWSQYEGPGFGIYSNWRGRLASGAKPSINNAGDVFFLAPGLLEPARNQVYKLAAGAPVPVAVTADGLDHLAVAASDSETVWAEFDPATSAGRIYSTGRGVLLSGVRAGSIDVNSCGEVVFTSSYGQGLSVSRLGTGAPCVSNPGSHATPEESVALASGDVLSTVLDDANPVSWYRFESAAFERAYLSVNWDNRPPNALKITIYDPAGPWYQYEWIEQGRPIWLETYRGGTFQVKVERTGGSFPVALSYSKYSVNCGAGVCPDQVRQWNISDLAINALGEIAYTQYSSGGHYQVLTTQRGVVTGEPVEHIGVGLNDLGDLVWVTRDPSTTPARYAVKGEIGGKAITVTSGAAVIDKVDVNDSGEVVWSQLDNGEWYLYSSRRGRLVRGARPSLDNRGAVTFTGYDGTDQVFRLAAGSSTPERLTSDGNRRLSVAATDNELVSLVEDPAGTRQWITSSTRGLLLSTVKNYRLDVNSCGDVAYLQENITGGNWWLYRLGNSAPCVSHAGVHDTMGSAAALAADSTAIAVVGTETGDSWYRFDATVGQPLEIRLNYDQTMFAHQMEVRVYDAQGNELAGPFATAMEFSAPATGTYYLKARCLGFGNGYKFSYSIAVRAKAPQLLKWVAEGEPEWYYATLKESLFHLPAAAELKLLLRDGELSEDVAVNVCEKTVRIAGGYDAGFSAVSGRTRVNGAVKVTCGNLVAEGLVIR